MNRLRTFCHTKINQLLTLLYVILFKYLFYTYDLFVNTSFNYFKYAKYLPERTKSSKKSTIDRK